tara:strand:- start:2320 stop:2946 length:627 start_codon:yes stop_codon:yes gene_type:complete
VPDFSIEKLFNYPVIGIDEVGRGPLAGPVVSSACIFFDYKIKKTELLFLDDSKKLSSKKINKAFKKILKLKNENKLLYSLGFATVNEIDKLNILEATKISMKRAVKKLNLKKANLIIDGKIDLQLDKFPSTSIIKGDQKSFSIATASIIAKIHRDRYMKLISKNFPTYGWDRNVGYGTKSHINEIYKNGFTIYHRKSFEPIKSLIHKK